MSIDKVQDGNINAYAGRTRNDAQPVRHDGYRKALEDAEVGQQVNLRIVDKLADRRFVATLNDPKYGISKYVVESAVPLTVGETVKATVSAVGGIVELKYLGAGHYQVVTPEEKIESAFGNGPGGSALEQVAERFRISLTNEQRQLVEALGDKASQPEALAMGAAFLSKLGEQIDAQTVQALYGQVAWDRDRLQTTKAHDVSALVTRVQAGDMQAVDELSQKLFEALDQSTANVQLGGANAMQLGAQGLAFANSQGDGGFKEDEQQALLELAKQLLNKQDDGSLAYRYGSLPVLIGGQMVELDLLLFRERESPGRPVDASLGFKKLVMTLRTETLGRIEIVAQSNDAKLSVAITSQSARSTESLSAHAHEVKDLVSRLGWDVDTVTYRLASEPQRAGGQLVKHVISSGSVDTFL